MDGPGAHSQPPAKRWFERRKWYGGQRYHLHRIRQSLSRADRMGVEVHYNSRLANKIHLGVYGVQYLDYKVLAEILFVTEPELVDSVINS